MASRFVGGYARGIVSYFIRGAEEVSWTGKRRRRGWVVVSGGVGLLKQVEGK